MQNPDAVGVSELKESAVAEASGGTAYARQLNLKRPLSFFDLETTGIDTRNDRIVEIGILKILPDGKMRQFESRINPQMPIPAEASAVHGIFDRDVANSPAFKDVAKRVYELVEDSDIGGFNIRRFDLLILKSELLRAGFKLSLENRDVIDAMEIFHKKEPRDLAAAHALYCGAEHARAHSAFADARASWKVICGQLSRYRDLPCTVPELAQHFGSGKPLDSGGCFEMRDGEIWFCFGTHRGASLKQIAAESPDYLEWMITKDFPEDSMEIARKALKR